MSFNLDKIGRFENNHIQSSVAPIYFDEATYFAQKLDAMSADFQQLVNFAHMLANSSATDTIELSKVASLVREGSQVATLLHSKPTFHGRKAEPAYQ